MQVVKVFTSQAKPCLIKASYVASEDSASKAKEGLFILKRGDDLRVDLMTQTMFYIFNRVWAQADLPHAPYCFLFKVIPMALDYGVVECVSGCTTLQEYDWTKWGLLDQSEKWKFLCSAAGGYTAGWILGIRDRHKENMMVKDDHVFVQIDFGHMFDRKTKYFDAPRFAVPSTMRSTISPEEWSAFKELCVDGFKILRRMGTTIVDLTCVRISQSSSEPYSSHHSLFSGIV
jgi:phosphatidylinositol kinase/protein kinase (PI-3  family)